MTFKSARVSTNLLVVNLTQQLQLPLRDTSQPQLQHHQAQPHDLALTTDSDHQWPTISAHAAGPMSGTDLTNAAGPTTETEDRKNSKEENNF